MEFVQQEMCREAAAKVAEIRAALEGILAGGHRFPYRVKERIQRALDVLPDRLYLAMPELEEAVTAHAAAGKRTFPGRKAWQLAAQVQGAMDKSRLAVGQALERSAGLDGDSPIVTGLKRAERLMGESDAVMEKLSSWIRMEEKRLDPSLLKLADAYGCWRNCFGYGPVSAEELTEAAAGLMPGKNAGALGRALVKAAGKRRGLLLTVIKSWLEEREGAGAGGLVLAAVREPGSPPMWKVVPAGDAGIDGADGVKDESRGRDHNRWFTDE